MNLKFPIDSITHIVAKKAYELFGDCLRRVILYGSYARGEYNDESDVDIMVLVDMPQAEHSPFRVKINELSGQLSLEYDITVSIKIKDSNTVNRYKNSIPFYANVLNDGVTINV